MITGSFSPMRADAKEMPDMWGPIFNVALSNGADPATTNIVAESIPALVDTGADVCYIDNSLAQQHSLQQQGTIPNYSAAGRVDMPIYIGALILGAEATLHMAFVGSDFEQNGFLHRALIGMEGLQFFDLKMCRRRDEISLEWIG